MLTLRTNPILNPVQSTASVEAELRQLPHLNEDRAITTKGVRRRCQDTRKSATAAEAIGQLPGSDEATHLAIGGKFALWNVVPAIHAISGERICRLHIATLGFSRTNIEELAAMLDAGTVGKAWLLCSHYFKSTSSDLYEFAEKEIGARPDQASFFSCRMHAKLLVMKLASGRTITVESSANLRSCKNIETLTLIGSPDVYEFHSRWIDDLFAQATGGP
jgi:hypothetical protein